MSQRVLACVTTVIGLAAARPAAAGKPKVEFLCGIYVDEKIVDIIPSTKTKKIDQPIACGMHLTDATKEVYTASITTRRHMVNPTNGDRADVEMMGQGGELSHKPGADAVDLELVMKPGVENAAGDIMFEACESFDITGSVSNASGVVFTKTLKVVQTCPKAKAPPPPPPEKPAPRPAPPVRPQPGGSGNPTVDDVLTFHAKQVVTAYEVQNGDAMSYVIGSCYDPGTNLVCQAAVLDPKGKVVHDLDEAINTSDADGNQVVDPARLTTVRATLDQALAHNQGNKLTEHVMGTKQVSYGAVGLRWNKRANTLTVLDKKKTFKVHNLQKLVGKGMAISGVSVYLFEAGSPQGAVVRVEYGNPKAEYISAMGSMYEHTVIALPEAMDGD